MKIMWGLAALAALLGPGPVAASEADDLSRLLRDNSWKVETSATGLSGPGAARIVAWSREAQFFLLGENHGSAGIARFATGVAKALGPVGFRHTVVEADPLVTDHMVRLLKQGGMPAFANWLATDQRQRAVPFFAWREEADFAVAALANGPVWGVDQSFLAAAHVHLDAIAAQTRDRSARTMAQAMAAEARADVIGWLAKVDRARIVALRDAIPARDAAARRIADLLVQSAAIYSPFSGGQGSWHRANLARETLMKRSFLGYYDAAAKRGGPPPRVLFKFGAWHLQRGLSETNVPSLGNFLAELALARYDRPVFNLRVMCGPGAEQVTFDGSVQSCGDEFAPLAPALGAALSPEGATVFDLRPLRDKPRLWRDWPAEAKRLVWTYDAVVVIRGGGAATFIAPPPK
jgi:hypothetical protein